MAAMYWAMQFVLCQDGTAVDLLVHTPATELGRTVLWTSKGNSKCFFYMKLLRDFR
jgi:hypothetical protein